MHEKWYSRNYKSMPVRGIYRMKEKLRLLLRKPAVIALLIAELLVIGFALAAALRPGGCVYVHGGPVGKHRPGVRNWL